jgi:hypothetical protein
VTRFTRVRAHSLPNPTNNSARNRSGHFDHPIYGRIDDSGQNQDGHNERDDPDNLALPLIGEGDLHHFQHECGAGLDHDN